MELGRLVRKDLIFLDLEVRDRASLLSELSRRIAEACPSLNEKKLLAGLLEREALGGTSVGHGIMFPHARIAPPGEETLAIARLKTPLQTGEKGEEPIWLVALTVTDPETPEMHLQLLAELAKLLNRKESLMAIKLATSEEELIAIIHTLGSPKKAEKFNLFIAILPDDEAVHDFLNHLASIGVRGATSVTARGMGEILSSGPTLFAGFRELFGAIGSARLVLSLMEDSFIEPACDEFSAFKEKTGVSGIAFYLPAAGVRGL